MKLCPHHCALEPRQTGLCRARVNWEEKIVPAAYGSVTALALDPIEKKPLRRFNPGSWILSVGSFGCNLRCPFCQNSEISMADSTTETVQISPGELTKKALELAHRPRGNLVWRLPTMSRSSVTSMCGTAVISFTARG